MKMHFSTSTLYKSQQYPHSSHLACERVASSLALLVSQSRLSTVSGDLIHKRLLVIYKYKSYIEF